MITCCPLPDPDELIKLKVGAELFETVSDGRVVDPVTDKLPPTDTADEKVPEVPLRAPLSVVIPPTPKLLATYPLVLIVTPVAVSMLRRRSETAGVACEEMARISPEGCCKALLLD